MSRRVQISQQQWKGVAGASKWSSGNGYGQGSKQVRPWTACPQCADGTFVCNYKIKPSTACINCGFLLRDCLDTQGKGTDYHVGATAKSGDADIKHSYAAAKASGDSEKCRVLPECFPRLSLDAPAPAAAEKYPAARYQSVTALRL